MVGISTAFTRNESFWHLRAGLKVSDQVGRRLALRQPCVEARRSRHGPFQAGNNDNHTGVSEARTVYYCYILCRTSQKST